MGESSRFVAAVISSAHEPDNTRKRAVGIILTMIMVGATGGDAQRARSFDVHEATIADIQRALQSKRITTVESSSNT